MRGSRVARVAIAPRSASRATRRQRTVDPLARALDRREDRVESRCGFSMNSWKPFIATLARSSLVSRSKYCARPSARARRSRPCARKRSSATRRLAVDRDLQHRPVERFLHVGAHDEREEPPRVLLVARPRRDVDRVHRRVLEAADPARSVGKAHELHPLAHVGRKVARRCSCRSASSPPCPGRGAPGSPASSTTRGCG